MWCFMFLTCLIGGIGTHEMRSVSVTGTGSVALKTDCALVTFGTQTEDPDAGIALRNNNNVMVNVINYLKSQNNLGITTDEIKTTSFDIRPLYDKSSRVRGYSVVHMLTVRLGSENVGELISEVTKLGTNRIGGIQFSAKDADKFAQKARELAMQDCKNKAEQIAKFVGDKLGNALSVVESSHVSVPRQAMYTTVEPGMTSVTSTISVRWELISR